MTNLQFPVIESMISRDGQDLTVEWPQPAQPRYTPPPPPPEPATVSWFFFLLRSHHARPDSKQAAEDAAANPPVSMPPGSDDGEAPALPIPGIAGMAVRTPASHKLSIRSQARKA